MSTEFLSMLQLADSFFPAGTYTMSNGLEALSKRKKVKADELQVLVRTHLERQVGPADCCTLGAAYESAKAGDIEGIIRADQALYAAKLVEEVRNASARSGANLVRCVAAFSNDALLAEYAKAVNEKRATGMHPVALGVACAALGIPKHEAGAMFLYSFCVGMAGAALRLGVIDHVAAQKMLHELGPAITAAVKENVDKPLDLMWQFAPAIDITQMEHEQLDSKMFIT
ncbi:urease accessory UreF family protein [Nitrososphaera sp.]|uniref:urease accessory protein UreF n=1 Tax=Nitrososphaera sp. TaxID=1971748 RepID=UPI0017DE9325|nr:urease accessory UreF family protein [Nitrososphaera sp.]NWG37433.1 urease accessory protein [Nitrososphaera sp.]